MFNPSRLTLARKRRRLTGRELAYLTGLTPVYISRIEQGKAENIEQSTIVSLSKALRFPVKFFSGQDVDLPTVGSASFPSISAMSAKERDAALSAGAIAFLLTDWITERFKFPEVDLLDLSHERKPDSAAKALRLYWGLGEKPVTNVVNLLESKGVRVFSLFRDTKNVDAFSCWREGIPYIFLNTFRTTERSRFDALRELAHLVLHRHGKPQGPIAEKEADIFASHFLMPSMDLVAHVPFVTSLKQLVQAKKRWGVSVAALAYRLNKSGTLSGWQYRTFCTLIYSLYGKSEPNGLPRERSVLWDKVFRELWKEKVTKDHVASELNIPSDEIDGLIFSLVGNLADITALKASGPPKLRLAVA